MNCPACGEKVIEGSKFCISCGAKIPEITSEIKDLPVEPVPDGGREPAGKKGRPAWLVPVLGIVLAVAAVVCLFVSGVFDGLGGGKTGEGFKLTKAYIGLDGTAYIVEESGKVTAYEGEYDSFLQLQDPDFLVMLEDNELAVSGYKMKSVVQISDACEDLYGINKIGLFYVEDGIDMLYRFADGQMVKLKGEADSYCFNNSGDLIYLTVDKQLYLLMHGEELPKKIFDGTGMYFETELFLSASGDTALFAVYDGSADIAYTWSNGKLREQLSMKADGYHGDYCNFYISGSSDFDCAVVTCSSLPKLLLLYNDEPEKIKIDGEGVYAGVYTEQGYLDIAKASDKSDMLYFCVTDGMSSDGTEQYSIHCLSLDGKEKTVADELTGYSLEIMNGYIVYEPDDGTYYMAKLDGAKLTDKTKIGRNIADVNFISDDTLLYVKDVEYVNEDEFIGAGTVYAYSVKDEDSVKLGSDVLVDYIDLSSIDFEMVGFYLPVGEDGGSGTNYILQDKSIILFQDMEEKDGVFQYTPVVYSLKTGEKEKLDEETMIVWRSLSENKVLFEQYVKTKKGKNVVDVLLYDGKEFKPLLEDVYSRIN